MRLPQTEMSTETSPLNIDSKPMTTQTGTEEEVSLQEKPRR